MVSSSEYLLETSREYAIYVCDTRGICSVIDGLKHGQRMALWVLKDKAEKIKTYALTGQLGFLKLHVHGEKSANDAISLLAAPYKNNICLIEGLGQFGSRIAPDKDGIGAPRYTEVKRSKAAEEFLYKDIDLIPLEDNYDGSNKPKHFLPLIPTVLLNGVSGVAVGWSTDILRRSFKDIVEATKSALLDKPIKTLVPYYERYNITVKPTDKPNQWEYSGKVELLDSSTIKVLEIPPGMAIESFRKRLIEMEDDETGLLLGFIDRSTETIDITIKMKRGSIKDWMEDQVLDYLKLREKTTERIVVVDWCGNRITTYDTAEQLVVDFAKWRLAWYTKRYEKLLKDASYERNYLFAIHALFENGFPTKLGRFTDKQSMEIAIRDIVEKLIDESQLERIMNLPTYRWTFEFSTEIDKKIAIISSDMRSYEEILASPEKLRQVYLDELEKLKKFQVK